MRSPNSQFPQTHWSLVRTAGVDDAQARTAALQVLLERYRPALDAYLRWKGLSLHDRDDTLQGFIADRVLQPQFLLRADPRRGRFRTFLLTSLNHYLIDRHRSLQSRLPEALDPALLHRPSTVDPQQAMDLEWARTLMRNVLAEMERHCRETARQDVWVVFESRVLRPIVDGCEPKGYQELAEVLQLRSLTQAANLLVTGKRLYLRLLRAAISEYESEESAIDSEILYFQQVLSSRTSTLDSSDDADPLNPPTHGNT